MPEHLEDVRLPDGASAVRRVRVAGEGWLTPEELERRSASDIRDYRYPLVLMYLVDAVAADGQPRTQEVTPGHTDDWNGARNRAPARIQSKGEVLS
ncbi:MAG: hypothetical protein V8R55_00090 [Dysosmobacter sp.]